MNGRRFSAMLALALMVLAFAGARAWTPTEYLVNMQPKVDLEAAFPRSFGDWKIDERVPVQLISPDQAYWINKFYSQTLSRTYVNAQGDRIMLSVAYGGDQSDATRAHRPEVCYPAAGFQIMSSETTTFKTPVHPLRVRQLVAKNGGRIEPITYWVTVGERIAISGTEQKLAQLSYSTRGVIPDGMLVRVSSLGSDSAGAYRLHESFVAQLSQALQPDIRTQIIGRNGG